MRRVIPILVALSGGCRALLGIDEARVNDAAFDDDSLDDARTCFGSGLVSLCLTSPPTTARTLASGAIDTITMCDEIVSLPGGVSVCVIVGTTITINDGTTVRAVGPRPLVLVAATAITIRGTLSVSSPRNGVPGAGTVLCAMAAQQGENGMAGAGGGGGGSLATAGGDGGDGNLDGTIAKGGLTGPDVPLIFQGGCPGARGGAGGVGNSLGGAGGGAVYMIAADSITVTGAITANGAGGNGGLAPDGGGAGGGSGGFVGFDAPRVTALGIVTANGGGGGEGAGNASGIDGADGGATTSPAKGGGGIAVNGGDGGDGNGVSSKAGAGGTGTGGGGGGGGGPGYIYVKSVQTTFTGTASPLPMIVL